MNIKENQKCELKVCINKVWKDCINISTKTIKYKHWSIPYLICNSCYDKLPKYLKKTAKIIEKGKLIMDNIKSYHCYYCYIRKICKKSYHNQKKIIYKFNKIINRKSIKYHGIKN